MLKYRIILPILLCLIIFVTGGCGAQERNEEISGDEEVIAQKESEDLFSEDTDNSDITEGPDHSGINAIEENEDSLKNDNVTKESHTTSLKEQKAGDDLQSYGNAAGSSDSVIASVTSDNDTADSVVADSDSVGSVYVVAEGGNDPVNTRKTKKYMNAKKDKTKKKYNKDANGEKTGTDHSGKNNSDGMEGNGKGDNGSKKGNQNTTQSSDNSNGNNGTDDNEGQIVLEEDNGIKPDENGDILLPEAP